MSTYRIPFITLLMLLLTAAAFGQVGRLEGFVRLPEHENPAVGATVVATRGNNDSLSTTTDGSGHFHFDAIPTGSYWVRASLTGYLSDEEQTTVRENHTTEIQLTLGRQQTGTGRVVGHVRLPFDGGWAVGARVAIYRSPMDSLVTTTDDSGQFVFNAAPVAFYSVTASLIGYDAGFAHVNVMNGRTSYITVFLRARQTGLGSVDGVVWLPRQSAPAANALVVLYNEQHDSMTTLTNNQGRFVFDSVQVGENHLMATLAPYGEAETMVMVMPGMPSHALLILRPAPDDGGSVEGMVQCGDHSPARSAVVELAGHGEHTFYRTETNNQGHFVFEHVVPGPYTITAMLPMRGFAASQVEVVERQTTHVTLMLHDSSDEHHGGDSLTVVDLQGTALVIRPDSANRPQLYRYYLDIDNDGAPDYRLSFGPPWYEPANGAHRPMNGNQITIHGGLLTYTDPPIVVVYEINGLLWRRPFVGHGGNSGGDHGRNGCETDSVTRVELEGLALVRGGNGYHGEFTVYGLDTDGNNQANVILDFGRPDYDPQNGAARPANGDTVAVVGGQIYCPNLPVPVVLVYEINGLFWREPGDTIGLGPTVLDAVDGPISVGEPLSYVTARNYPNPFNPTTTISYSIPVAGAVHVTVFDLTGRQVAEPVSGYQARGSYVIGFDGSALPSGIYFCRVDVAGLSFTNRMLLLK
jgi:hypothetical protein